MTENEDWKINAIKSQNNYFEIFGSRQYDKIPKSNLFLLKKKVGFAVCGRPNELPNMSNYNTGYSEEQIQFIKQICDKIIEKSDRDPICFACTILILHHEKEITETSVFRIVTELGNIFIDAHGRTYQNWERYMETNKLPDCEYCYPVNGEYFTKNKEMRVGFAFSPASSLISKAINCADSAGSVASIGAAAVFATSLAITVAPAALAVAGATAGCSAAYSLTRSVGDLVDRKNHEQSIGLDDKESRSAWLNVGSSVLCVGTGLAIDKAKKIVEGGKSLSNAAKCGLHVLTATSVVFSGYGFFETFVNCVDKYQRGVLTKKDVFDLSCELLFLFNALASAKATTNLVSSMSAVSEGPSVQKKLTKTQKRNLRRRAAKRRAKGFPSTTENSHQTSENITSTYIQSILLTAATAYVPKVEEVSFICQSIGHDIMSWRASGMSLENFLFNTTFNLNKLFTMFKEEINEVETKVVNYFKSLNFVKYKNKFFEWFNNSSKKLKSFFLSIFMKIEDEFETMISETEKDIMDLHEQLKVQLSDGSNYGNADESNDSDLSPEVQILLHKLEELDFIIDTFCDNLEDFGDVVEEVKHLIVNDYKIGIANYIESLNAAKGETFDINVYHKTLNIKCDVTQHFFNKTIESLSSDSSIYKITKKLKSVKLERKKRTAHVWELMTNTVYQFYGTHGAGLLKEEIFSIVSHISNKELREPSCKWLDHKDLVMIEANDEGNDNASREFVVSYKLNEENTAVGMIIILK